MTLTPSERRYVKRRQTFRVYPTGQQEKDLSRLFGCTRVVRNHFINIMRPGDTRTQ